MTKHLFAAASLAAIAAARPRSRGLIAVRNDTTSLSDVNAAVNRVNQAFEAFKVANDRRLAEIEARGSADTLTTELTARINAAIDPLNAEVDRLNARLAAVQTEGEGGTTATPERRAYAQAFNTWFRRGDGENDLNNLAVQAAYSRPSDPDGGYVVTPEMDTAITRVQTRVSSMRSVASVRTISSNALKKLVNTGGTGAGWVGETEARPQTDGSQLKPLDFPVMELYAMPAATQSLLDDASINIEAWLADEVGITFAEQEGAAFIVGTGKNQPRGILAYDTVADASYAWGKIGYYATGASADFATTDPSNILIDLVYGLKQGYRQNAQFLMNRFTQGKVRKFKDGQGNYIWQPSAQAGQPATLMGYGVIDDDNMPDVGAGAFPIAFGDFNRGYQIVDRTGVRVLRDPYTAKPYVLFYTTKRVGGGVQNFEAIKLLKVATS